MILLPTKLFVNELKIGNIYLFIKHKLKSTEEPHYFIVMGKSDGELVLFSCCTKRLETILRHNKISGTSNDTIVEIKPDENNKLPKDTYINCNSVIPHTIDELYSLSQKGHMKYQGCINQNQIVKIQKGINISKQVVGEFKDIINNGQD